MKAIKIFTNMLVAGLYGGLLFELLVFYLNGDLRPKGRTLIAAYPALGLSYAKLTHRFSFYLSHTDFSSTPLSHTDFSFYPLDSTPSHTQILVSTPLSHTDFFSHTRCLWR